ncbi:MAG: A24 family peptidase [Chloroflexota bacterium]|nr:A24 family peptidase [Chloroflexota bacterium]
MINILWLIPFSWGLGGLVNYLADTLPRTRHFSKPACPACQETFPWHYTLWPKKCQACGEKRALRVWIVLILGVVTAIWLWQFPPARLGFGGALLWSVYFALVVVIDIEHHLILHPVSLAGAVLGAGFGVALHGALPTLLGGVAGFGIMLGLYYLGELFLKLLIRIRGEETDEVPLGFGDVNLAGVIGLLLGWPGITAGLLLAILIGGVVSGLYLLIALILRRYQAYTALPYGPFLAASAVLLLFGIIGGLIN